MISSIEGNQQDIHSYAIKVFNSGRRLRQSFSGRKWH